MREDSAMNRAAQRETANAEIIQRIFRKNADNHFRQGVARRKNSLTVIRCLDLLFQKTNKP
jgi:hypothetical protein